MSDTWLFGIYDAANVQSQLMYTSAGRPAIYSVPNSRNIPVTKISDSPPAVCDRQEREVTEEAVSW